jgi:hypothetical protein
MLAYVTPQFSPLAVYLLLHCCKYPLIKHVILLYISIQNLSLPHLEIEFLNLSLVVGVGVVVVVVVVDIKKNYMRLLLLSLLALYYCYPILGVE